MGRIIVRVLMNHKEAFGSITIDGNIYYVRYGDKRYTIILDKENTKIIEGYVGKYKKKAEEYERFVLSDIIVDML